MKISIFSHNSLCNIQFQIKENRATVIFAQTTFKKYNFNFSRQKIDQSEYLFPFTIG